MKPDEQIGGGRLPRMYWQQCHPSKRKGCPNCHGVDAKSCMRCFGKTRLCDWWVRGNGWEHLPELSD